MSVGHNFGNILRQQLQELRIDPDIAAPARRRWLASPRAWLGEHPEALLISVAAATFLTIAGTCLLLLATQHDSAPSPAPSHAPPQTTVSFGNLLVAVTAPAYHRYAAGEGSILLHLQLQNTSAAQTRLLAGDLLLVDGRGALFPPSWIDANGNSVDGLQNPSHVFVGLDPGSATAIDLQFLVLSDGPFSLRYVRAGAYADAELPGLTLS